MLGFFNLIIRQYICKIQFISNFAQNLENTSEEKSIQKKKKKVKSLTIWDSWVVKFYSLTTQVVKTY